MRGWWIGAGVSVGVHLILALAAVSNEPPPPRRSPTSETIRFTVREVTPEAPPSSEPAAVAARDAPPRAEPRPRVARARDVSIPKRGRASPARDVRASSAQDERAAGATARDGRVPVGGSGPSGADGSEGSSGSSGFIGPRPAEDDAVAELAPRLAPPTVLDAPLILPPPPPPAPDTRLKPKAGGGFVSKHQSFTGTIEHDGTVEFEDHIAGYTGLGFWFDVTDTVMMLGGDDAYSAAKLRLLDDTREQRLAMSAEACEERLDQTLYALRGDLESIWQDPALTAEAKRRTIFQLWDDCAEEGAESVVTHGKMARVTIVEFIKKVLPEDSPFAYTRDELVALNARRASNARFEPYANRP